MSCDQEVRRCPSPRQCPPTTPAGPTARAGLADGLLVALPVRVAGCAGCACRRPPSGPRAWCSCVGMQSGSSKKADALLRASAAASLRPQGATWKVGMATFVLGWLEVRMCSASAG